MRLLCRTFAAEKRKTEEQTMTIAVDFDGTIVRHRYPAIGEEIPFAVQTLKMLTEERHQLILWTRRGHHAQREFHSQVESGHVD